MFNINIYVIHGHFANLLYGCVAPMAVQSLIVSW